MAKSEIRRAGANQPLHDLRTRAGKYIPRDRHRTFLPKPLPPDPPVEFTAELASLLEHANLALGRLDGSAQILPNPELFVSMYVRKEAVLSSQIEGTQASLIDVLEFESQIADTDLPGDVSEVVGYVKALQQGLARVPEERLSLKLIRDLHRTLLSEGRGADQKPGEFRKVQNWIGPKGGIGRAVFVPPSPEDVEPALRDLESFLNAEPAMPAVIVAGLAHVQFETIHPFIDGNGRTGRLLLTLLLCQRKVLSQPLLYLSEYFKRRRAEYYDRLQAVRDDGDWEGWIRFYLNGIAEVAGEAALTARKIIALRESHRQLVTEQMKHSSGNALSFLERLYFRPVVTVRAVQDMTQVSFSNASKLVARFEELGILREMTGQRRNRRFKYAEYLALFAPEEDE